MSWPAVAAGTAVGMAIAWVWYSDWGLVGGTWRELTGVTPQDSARAGKRPFAVLAASILVTAMALTATVSVASASLGTESLWLAPAVAFTVWLGFSLSTLAQHNGFEQKPARLTGINSAYQLVLFLGMSVAIGLLQ